MQSLSKPDLLSAIAAPKDWKRYGPTFEFNRRCVEISIALNAVARCHLVPIIPSKAITTRREIDRLRCSGESARCLRGVR